MISVLVPVRRAGTTIAQTVESLLAQCVTDQLEIILAVCEDDPSLAGVKIERPIRVVTVKAPAGVPQLRREAAIAARGDYLIITEDHCRFPVGWLAGLAQALTHHPGAVCGGPVDNGRHSVTGWAQYFTRYSAFLPVRPDGTGNNLPGNNACYPRALIENRAGHLREGFWEAEFNGELARSGVSFFLVQKLAVTQHQDRGAGEYIPLRFRHGRCYGARRFAGSQLPEKARLLALSPLLPLILYVRMLRSVMLARWHRVTFLAVSPLILLYVCAWSLGEIAGYVTGPGSSCTETD